MPAKGVPHPVLATEEGIQVAAVPAGHSRQELGIEIVGAHLEGLHPGATLAGQGHKGEAHQGFAAAAAGSSDQAAQERANPWAATASGKRLAARGAAEARRGLVEA